MLEEGNGALSIMSGRSTRGCFERIPVSSEREEGEGVAARMGHLTEVKGHYYDPIVDF